MNSLEGVIKKVKSKRRFIMRALFIWIVTGFILIFLFFFSPINWAEEGKWTKKASMPTPRCGLSTSVVNGKIYAIGGATDSKGIQTVPTVEEYDPVTDTWTRKADMPTPRNWVSTSVVNGKIYAIGGRRKDKVLSAVEEYDPARNKWTKKANMPIARERLSTSVVNGKIYAIGGGGGVWPNNRQFSTVEEYDPLRNTWTKKAGMPTPRSSLSTGVVDGKIYAIGGWDGNAFIRTVEEYNPETNRWTKKADIPEQAGTSEAVTVNRKIYVMTVNLSVEEYNPATDRWTTKANMPKPRWFFSTSAVNGKIFLIGGITGFDVLSTVEEYDTGFTGRSIEAKGKLPTLWGALKAED